jgi:putative membrane protein
MIAMKTLGYITGIILMLMVLILSACKNNIKNDSEAKADSANAKKDTTAQLSIAVEKGDAEFAVEAASGSLAEVELGKLAKLRGYNRRVKSFGTMMMNDHSKINDEMKALAVTKNISIPKIPGADEQKIIKKLSEKSGKDFDKAYISDMIADHENDIKTFQNAAKNCADPDVKSFASKTLPILQAHLDAINAIKDSMN